MLDSVSSTRSGYGALDSLSSRNSRERILDAALDLIAARGEAKVTMGEIASAAGVSRQAVYLHFADQAELMLDLVRHTDAKRNLDKELRRIRNAPTARDALRAMVEVQSRMNPSVWAVARAFDAVRRSDPAVEKGWQDRLQFRLQGCREMVARLEAEGALKTGLDASTATDLLWTITSLRVWEDLVLERGWSAPRYQKHITRVLVAALTNPLSA